MIGLLSPCLPDLHSALVSSGAAVFFGVAGALILLNVDSSHHQHQP